MFGAVDGNRTRLNLIDNQVPYPEDYNGIYGTPNGFRSRFSNLKGWRPSH